MYRCDLFLIILYFKLIVTRALCYICQITYKSDHHFFNGFFSLIKPLLDM